MFNLDFLRRSSLMGTTLRAVPSKSHAFSTNYHTCIAMPTWHRCAPPILFWPWPPYTLLPRSCFTWMFFVDPHWWVPLCVQCPAKAMHFKQIIMYALQCQHDVDVHLLFWHWPPFNMFPSSCITWIFPSFLTDGYHFVYSTQQSICHFDKLSCIYCNAHMIYMYTYFCFDLHKFLLRSHIATCPTLNCGLETSLFRQELVDSCKWLVSLVN